eukprot:Awhi_evm1s5673
MRVEPQLQTKGLLHAPPNLELYLQKRTSDQLLNLKRSSLDKHEDFVNFEESEGKLENEKSNFYEDESLCDSHFQQKQDREKEELVNDSDEADDENTDCIRSPRLRNIKKRNSYSSVYNLQKNKLELADFDLITMSDSYEFIPVSLSLSNLGGNELEDTVISNHK